MRVRLPLVLGGLAALALATRGPAAAAEVPAAAGQHLRGVRTTLVAADGGTLHAAAAAITVAPARLFGPLGVGIAPTVRADDVVVEWRTPITWPPLPSRRHAAPLAALGHALTSLPAAHERASSGEPGRAVVVLARRCELGAGRVRCRKGVLQIGERTSFFRSLTFDGRDWRFEPAAVGQSLF